MTMEWYVTDWLLSPGSPPRRNGAAAVAPMKAGISHILEIGSSSPGGERRQAGTSFLTPGLINAHTHIEMYAPEPISPGADGTMGDWILKVVAKNRGMNEAERRLACQKSVLEMLQAGTTCINDITSDEIAPDVLAQTGIRGIVSPEFFYPFHTEKPDMSKVIHRFNLLKQRFENHPLLNVGISPHSPYNVTPKAMLQLLQVIDPVLIHTHLAETEEEIRWFQTGSSPLDKVHQTLLGEQPGPIASGITPVKSFSGVLDARWVAAHGVYLTDPDIERLRQAGASLVHCPRSNLWLSGESIPDYRKLLQAGVPVGLGTDSRYSAPDLDIRAEGRVAQQLHSLSAQEVFEMMTIGSARAIKQQNKVGSLLPGYLADLVLWWNPGESVEEPYTLWLSPETRVEQVVVNGRTIWKRDSPSVLPWVD